MNFYNQILNTIAGSEAATNLQIDGTVFQDVFYFIAGMEKRAEHPGIPFYTSLARHFRLMDQIDQDEMGEDSIPDFCEKMISEMERRYIISLSDGSTLNDISTHQDFLKSHSGYNLFACMTKREKLKPFKNVATDVSDIVVTPKGVYQLPPLQQPANNTEKCKVSVSAHALFFLRYAEINGVIVEAKTLMEYSRSSELDFKSFSVTCYGLMRRIKYGKSLESGKNSVSRKTFDGAIILAAGYFTVRHALEKDIKILFKAK